MLEGGWGGGMSGNAHTHTHAEADVYTGTHRATHTHKESLQHLVRVSGGKYLPTGIITERLPVWPRRQPN